MRPPSQPGRPRAWLPYLVLAGVLAATALAAYAARASSAANARLRFDNAAQRTADEARAA